MNFLRKIRRNHHAKLDNKIVTDNEHFWNAAIPLFLEKVFHKQLIICKGKAKPSQIKKISLQTII